jgi:hypothetical protein
LQNMLQSYFPIHKTYFSFHAPLKLAFFLSLTPLRCRIIFWGFWHFSRIEQWTPNTSVAFFSYFFCLLHNCTFSYDEEQKCFVSRTRDGRLVTEKSFKIKQIILEFGTDCCYQNGKL